MTMSMGIPAEDSTSDSTSGTSSTGTTTGTSTDLAALERAARLYDALEALGELGVADRLRRVYQADALRHPARRVELRLDLVDRLHRALPGAIARGVVASVSAYVADADAEVDRLLG